MPNFTSGRITTNAIFFRAGVPNSDKDFGRLVSINYEMLRQIARYNRSKNGGRRELYKLF
jgi:hypothetical protein